MRGAETKDQDPMKHQEGRDVNEMAGVHQALGTLVGKMDRVIAHIDRTEAQVHEQELRLNKVEGRQHWYAGIMAAGGYLISFFFTHKLT